MESMEMEKEERDPSPPVTPSLWERGKDQETTKNTENTKLENKGMESMEREKEESDPSPLATHPLWERGKDQETTKTTKNTKLEKRGRYGKHGEGEREESDPSLPALSHNERVGIELTPRGR